MSRSFVWTLAFCLMGFIFVGVTYADPEWPLEYGFDSWNLPQYQAELEACRRVNEDLDQRCLVVRRRNETKQSLAQDVFRDRLTLQEAAVEFRELSPSNPGIMTVLRRAYPNCSDDELYCRNVIAIVRSLAVSAAQRDQIVAGLEAQLQMLKTNGGGVISFAH